MIDAGSPLAGKHIVLGVTGSIAAYKAAVLVRLLIKRGAEVQVIMTPAATEFITPLTLSTLTSRPVITEFFSRRDGSWNSHVDLGLWADALLMAPATASTVGKMAHGIADNMAITTYLSAKAPVFIAPAMDLDMYRHPCTQENLALLRHRGNHVIEPAEGELASRLVGKGRMEEPESITAFLEDFFAKKLKAEPFIGKRALVTAGPTYENIDPVRFIGNYSSGRMGVAVADSLANRGADVTLILGPSAERPKNSGVKVRSVCSANEMLAEAEAIYAASDIAVFAAAVADYRPAARAEQKIKRGQTDKLSIDLVRNPDIAATLARTVDAGRKFLVGFALETDAGVAEARRKLVEKGLDAVVLNSLAEVGAGFGHDTNKVTIIGRNGDEKAYSLKNKAAVADDISDYIAARIE